MNPITTPVFEDVPNILVFKNFEALYGLEFVALYCIELARATSEQAYNECVKRSDIFKQKRKQVLNRLCNPKGQYFSTTNDAGILRNISRLYRINLTDAEQCALADMSDYFDALVKPELNRIRNLINNAVASSETVTKNHGLIITLTNAYIVASICHTITARVHEITIIRNGRKATAYLRDQNVHGGSTERTIPINGSLCQRIQHTTYDVLRCALCGESFYFDIPIIESATVKLINRLIDHYNLSIAAAFGGIDIEDENPNRTLIEDTEALVAKVRSRFEQEETDQNKKDLKALFESKGWSTKIAS